MKIFAVYIKIKLTEKPEWFEEFLKKYFEPVNLHITLIQPRSIHESQIEGLESKVAEVIKKLVTAEGDKKVVFDKLTANKKDENAKYIFMLGSRNNSFLTNLQKELMSALKGYDLYVDEKKKEYELNFKPHITVAIDLDEDTKKEAEKYFTEDFKLVGVMEELILPVVKDQSIEERTNINNFRVFKL